MNTLKEINFAEHVFTMAIMKHRKEDLLKGLKKLREEKGLTQVEIATHLGIGKQQYYNIESGRNEMTLKQFFDVMEVLEVSMLDVLKNSDAGFDVIAQAEIETLRDIKQYIETKLNQHQSGDIS